MFIPQKRRKERMMCEQLLDIEVEAFDEEAAAVELIGMEDQFADKMTDGVGEDIGEVTPDPYEEEEY